MVIEFLNKYQTELLDEKSKLEPVIEELHLKITEDNKFYDMLTSTNEQYFTEFSPRNLNEKNNKRAEEVKLKITENQSLLKQYEDRLQFLDSRLSELDLVFAEVNSNFINQDNIASDDSNVSSTSSLKQKLIDLKSTILLDPYRASVELEQIMCNYSEPSKIL